MTEQQTAEIDAQAAETDGEVATPDGQSAYDVHDRLRSMILDGDFDGQGAFSQVKLAEMLGVSRTPLREALRMLESEGLIESTPNRKARVTPTSVEDLDELYGLRIMLEGLAVYVSVQAMTAVDIADLDRLLDEMDQCAAANDRVGWEVPHDEFHRTLVRHAGDRLVRQTADLRDHSRRYLSRLISEPLAWAAGADEHQQIVAACRDRDPARAADRLGVHLARTALTLVTQMAPQHNPLLTRGALHFVQTTAS